MSNSKNPVRPYTQELLQYTDDELIEKAKYYIQCWDDNKPGKVEIRDFYFVYNEILNKEKEQSNCSSCHDGPVEELRFFIQEKQKAIQIKTQPEQIIFLEKENGKRGRKKKSTES